MKKSLILVGMLSIGYAYAQEGSVGINTETPKATLEIVPNATNLAGTTNEGIIIPKLTKARVVAIAADKLVEGTKVYVTDEVTAADTQFIGAGKGFYFYNGTKWVKQLTSDTDTNSELWAQRDNAGVTETYLKPADANSDKYLYSEKGALLNLGGVTREDTRWVRDGNYGWSEGEVPNMVMINSDKLSLNSNIGNGATGGQGTEFYFNKNFSLLKEAHASAGNQAGNKTYVGNVMRLSSLDVTSKINSITGTAIGADAYSGATITNLTGLGVSTVAGSDTQGATVTNNIGASFGARNFPTSTSTNLIGMSASVDNYGKVSNIIAGRFTATSSRNYDALGVVNPAQTIQDLRGILASVENRPNSTTAFLRGAHITADFQNASVATEGFGIDVRSYVKQGSQVDMLSNVNSYIRANYGAATVKEVYGFRFHHMLNADFKPTNMYGLYLADVNRATDLNYAIYSNAGKVRLGDLKGTGNRIVTVDADGVLSTSDATAIAAQNIYNTDGTLTSNRVVDMNKKSLSFINGGNVGINNNNPVRKLDVVGGARFAGENGGFSIWMDATSDTGNAIHRYRRNGSVRWDMGMNGAADTDTHGGADFYITSMQNDGVTGARRFTILRENGNVGIGGMLSPSEKLEVAGNVKANAFLGANGATIFPDYVFQKYYTGTSSIKSDYSFKTLSQVEDFVKTNGHLPGYKSAETIKAQGYVDLMETQLTNVEKIEELYLHLMEKDKEVKTLQSQNEELKNRLERLEKLIK